MDIPDFVQHSRNFITRKKNFIENYIVQKDYQNSQEILQTFSQNPNVVKASKTLKRKLEHLTYEERASKLVIQSVSNCISKLKQTPGSAAKNQVKVVVAAVTHHRWGTPDLTENISWRTKTQAKQMKIDLLTGNNQILTPPPNKKKKIIPEGVEKIALKHWTDTTIPEPAVQRRMMR